MTSEQVYLIINLMGVVALLIFVVTVAHSLQPLTVITQVATYMRGPWSEATQVVWGMFLLYIIMMGVASFVNILGEVL